MPRTVLPPSAAPVPGVPGTRQPDAGDDLPTKLVKYVPAETLAFFVPAAAAVGAGRNGLLIAVLVVAAVGSIGWLWYRGSTQPPEQRPLIHFYVLSVIAFLVWAVATAPNVAAMIGLDGVAAGVLLAAGVFLIPLTDGILSRWLGRPEAVRSPG